MVSVTELFSFYRRSKKPLVISIATVCVITYKPCLCLVLQAEARETIPKMIAELDRSRSDREVCSG